MVSDNIEQCAVNKDSGITRLLSIMQQLRDPQQGCAWDKQQTIASLAAHTLEEAYEVLDAIERQDLADLKQELGDLLFQIIFYAQIANEQSLFNFDDICHAISDKLEHRHPHIFTAPATISQTQAIQNWEMLKQQERAQKAQLSAMDDIPTSMPALMRAYKIQKRCAAVGFDWTTLGPVLAKVHEELDEVMHEATQTVVDQTKLEEELGDMLFAMVNLTRHLGHRAETALQVANRKFERRFRQVEQDIVSRGQTLAEATLDEMEAAWQRVKQAE